MPGKTSVDTRIALAEFAASMRPQRNAGENFFAATAITVCHSLQ